MIALIGYISFLLLCLVCLCLLFAGNIMFLINIVYPTSLWGGLVLSFTSLLAWLAIVGLIVVYIEEL